jgi:Ca-activated chloride channel family protein
MRRPGGFVLAGLLAAPLVLGLGGGAGISGATGSIEGVVRADSTTPLAGAQVSVNGTLLTAKTGTDGHYRIDSVPAGASRITARMLGYRGESRSIKVRAGKVSRADFVLKADVLKLDELVVAGQAAAVLRKEAAFAVGGVRAGNAGIKVRGVTSASRADFNTEEYKRIYDNAWQAPSRHPLSTFSIDVDAASYTNIRRFVAERHLPPKDAVRIEEIVNYFRYAYPEPVEAEPFTVMTELASTPWNANHRLALIGLQSQRIPMEALPPNNLVFLLDVSGSMDEPSKLPLVKSAFRLLVNQLRPQDRVAIVVYAGAAGQVLASTPGDRKDQILDCLERLEAGGSTAGAQGIVLAYAAARKSFLPGGNNRVILATDGDFNVGVSSEGELVRLIEEQRQHGIFLTVLGFGTGNLKDAKMEQLADKGNGNYAYVDNILEARKVFVQELGATLLTVAKDVKIQVEFNPARVAAYRLIGYENRLLADEDFNDDTKDAGELGAGHSVTALYEIVPAGAPLDVKVGSVDSLRYQRPAAGAGRATGDGEWMTVKLRYKEPAGSKSRLIARTLSGETAAPSESFRFASAVAGVGMLLRDSEHKGAATYQSLLALARGARGEDREGYRAEFIRMLEMIDLLSRQVAKTVGQR